MKKNEPEHGGSWAAWLLFRFANFVERHYWAWATIVVLLAVAGFVWWQAGSESDRVRRSIQRQTEAMNEIAKDRK